MTSDISDYLSPATASRLQLPFTGTEGYGRGIDVEKRMTQMQRRLNLTADQVDRIRPILQRENDRMRDLRSKNPNQNGSTDRSTVTNEMRQIRQDSMKQIESVLTPEQAAKLHKEKQRTGRNGRSRSS